MFSQRSVMSVGIMLLLLSAYLRLSSSAWAEGKDPPKKKEASPFKVEIRGVIKSRQGNIFVYAPFLLSPRSLCRRD